MALVDNQRSYIDLSDFHDTVVLGDALISVREESGAIIKVKGSRVANRNPAASRLKPMNSMQMARVIQRAAKRELDYALMHPNERYCSACHEFHDRSLFGKNGRNRHHDGLQLACTDAVNRAQRQRYAARQVAAGRSYTPQPNKQKPHKKKGRNR